MRAIARQRHFRFWVENLVAQKIGDLLSRYNLFPLGMLFGVQTNLSLGSMAQICVPASAQRQGMDPWDGLGCVFRAWARDNIVWIDLFVDFQVFYDSSDIGREDFEASH